MMENSLATELLHEVKMQSRRWFIAFIVVLFMWIGTIVAFLWYISLPVETTTTATVENTDGNATYIGEDMNGELTYG